MLVARTFHQLLVDRVPLLPPKELTLLFGQMQRQPAKRWRGESEEVGEREGKEGWEGI